MKVFIDCGANKGQSLKHFTESFKIDSDWVIELFEPNSVCKTEDYITIPHAKLHNKAVWDKNGTVPFSLMLENDEGSSVNCLMETGICQEPSSPAYRHHKNIVEVECVDISDILNQYHDDDFIVVKIDVEGSEFTIIRKMLKDDTIKKINHLFVEWHTPYLSSETSQSESELKSSILDTGVTLHDWH